MDTNENSVALSLTNVPIHQRLKPDKAIKKKKRISTIIKNITVRKIKQKVVEVPVQLATEKQPERVTIVERAIGSFNADTDEPSETNPLNTSTKKGPPFICNICNYWFYTGTKLKIHYVTNHQLKHCHVCNCLFESEQLRAEHLGRFHLTEFCEICKTNVTDLLEHYGREHNSVTCQFCGALQSCCDSSDRHLSTRHCIDENYLRMKPEQIVKLMEKGRMFFCQLCQKPRELDTLYGHMNTFHKLNLTCLLNILTKQQIVIDVNGYKALKKQEPNCRVCSDEFTQRNPSIFHSIYCQGRFLCKHCRKTYANKSLRDRHVRNSHSRLDCLIGCKRTFNSETNLHKHYAKTHKLQPCAFCNSYMNATDEKYANHLLKKHNLKTKTHLERTKCLFTLNYSNVNEFEATCSLCNENITSLMIQVRDLIKHFRSVHCVSAKRISELLTAKPKRKSSEVMEKPKSNFAEIVETDVLYETDFDLNEIEIYYESDSEREERVPEPGLTCGICKLKQVNSFKLSVHLKEKHKILARYKHCSTIFNTNELYKTHLSEHKNRKQSLPCDCETVPTNSSFVRKHLVEQHSADLERFKLSKFGLKCRFCKHSTWTRAEMNAHEVGTHFGDNSEEFFKCYKCTSAFSEQKCLNDHVKSVHPDCSAYTKLIYKCLHCIVTLPSIDSLREHFRTEHSDSKVFVCRISNCYKTYKSEKYLKTHLQQPHKRNPRYETEPAPCDICGKMLKNLQAATIHRLMKHNRDNAGFECRICNQRFQTNEERKLHWATVHKDELAYSCSECGKGFVSKSGLYGHRKTHQTTFTKACPHCNKEFFRRDSYNEHLLIHVGPRLQCPHCPKSFTQRSNLTRHVRIHTGLKPYQCMYCTKQFSDQGACRSHERVHTKEEHCECSYCGKKFSKRQKLKYHLKFHTGEGLVDCDLCGKQFSTTYSMLEHRRIHNQETLFMCKHCGRGFSSNKYLQRHVLNMHDTSKREPNFVCQICSRPFLYKSAYNDHVLTHATVKCFRCLLCKHEFTTKKTLRRHLHDQHELEPDENLAQHIYCLTPEEAGLNLVTPQSPFNVNDPKMNQVLLVKAVLEDKKNEPKIVQKIKSKAEPKIEENGGGGGDVSEVMIETKPKRKVKTPIKTKMLNNNVVEYLLGK